MTRILGFHPHAILSSHHQRRRSFSPIIVKAALPSALPMQECILAQELKQGSRRAISKRRLMEAENPRKRARVWFWISICGLLFFVCNFAVELPAIWEFLILNCFFSVDSSFVQWSFSSIFRHITLFSRFAREEEISPNFAIQQSPLLTCRWIDIAGLLDLVCSQKVLVNNF
jgi:hypothetical protein